MPACRNTWLPESPIVRSIDQLGNVAHGHPAFLAYDAAAYLLFFDRGDPLGRTFEWWQGAGG